MNINTPLRTAVSPKNLYIIFKLREITNYRNKSSTVLIASGKQKTIALSPSRIWKSPNDIKAFPSLIIPPKTASLGSLSSLIGFLVTLAPGGTSNSNTSASILWRLAKASISPFRMCLNMLLAAISFLLISVLIPMVCEMLIDPSELEWLLAELWAWGVWTSLLT